MSEETDTPICDNAEFISGGVRTGWVRAATARLLERKNAELRADAARIEWMENMNAAELRELFDMVDHKTSVRMAIDKLAARLTSEAAQNDSGALP